jgi:hypothetical protein
MDDFVRNHELRTESATKAGSVLYSEPPRPKVEAS